MTGLFRKEIIQFFGSLTGYVVILSFLATGGLFLWVFPGNYNIPENGYASLESFFQLAPWLYLFLIPAITMRLFSEEKKTGTIELLFTRPIGDFQMVMAKFLAAIVIVLFTLIPTMIWYLSVIYLGNPVGNLDQGSTWGALIGLFLLASAFIAIGIFSSSISENQIVAFIISLLLSFISYLGFEFIASSGLPYFLERIFNWLSINDHYLSVSRGVIDIRDVIFFLGITAFYLILTVFFLRFRRTSYTWWRNRIIVLLISVVVLIIISVNFRYRIDLTAEKRYSLSPQTKSMIKSLDEPVSLELFLDGELPPGFRKLQQAIIDKVNDFNNFSRKPIRITVSDPYTLTSADKRQAFFRQLEEMGIKPVDLRNKTEKGIETTRIFPGAVITKGERRTSVSFLMNNPGLNHEVNLNHSVENIEYALVSALKKLTVREKPALVFLQGNGECSVYEVGDIRNSLAESFQVDFKEVKDLMGSTNLPKVVIIADPVKPFSETEKFIIDQLLMKGSRLMWLIDPVNVSLDSLSRGYMTIAFPRDLNLNDQLFHYGVRLNSDLIQDISCASILVNTSSSSDRPDFTPQPWYYSPLLTPSEHHPVSRNLNQIYSEFVSSIDTVEGRGDIRCTVILSSSPYGREIRTPAAVSLESINTPPAKELFRKPFIPTGVLLEGRFTSVFRNRLLNNLEAPVSPIADQSPETRMMVFSDGNLIANKVRYPAGKQPEMLPLGYDMVSLQTFGNKEFFMNAICYLADDEGIMQLRNASFRLRLLDKVKLRDGATRWKWINAGLPPAMVLVFAFVFTFIRNRKYSKHIY
jgi:ABC-2 type transport system permease protein